MKIALNKNVQSRKQNSKSKTTKIETFPGILIDIFSKYFVNCELATVSASRSSLLIDIYLLFGLVLLISSLWLR